MKCTQGYCNNCRQRGTNNGVHSSLLLRPGCITTWGSGKLTVKLSWEVVGNQAVKRFSDESWARLSFVMSSETTALWPAARVRPSSSQNVKISAILGETGLGRSACAMSNDLQQMVNNGRLKTKRLVTPTPVVSSFANPPRKKPRNQSR